MCDSCAQYLRRVGCAFELESHDFELVNAESAKSAEYIDFVSIDVVFVEFARLEFDDLESTDSGELVSDKSESKELRKSFHYDVSQPKQREIEVYGIHEATARARYRFIMDAVRAISSAKHGRGLDRYYLSSLDYTNTCGLSVAIKWAIFLRDVKVHALCVIKPCEKNLTAASLLSKMLYDGSFGTACL
jgi:hypothetical protein